MANNEAKQVVKTVAILTAGLGLLAIAGPVVAVPVVGGLLMHVAKESGKHLIVHSPELGKH